MLPPFSFERTQAKIPHVYHCRLLAREELEAKIKWCLDLFHILDGVLCEFITIVHPKLHNQDEWMDTTEEKIEILTYWFNNLRLLKLKNSSAFEEFIYGQKGKSVIDSSPMVWNIGKCDSFC